MIKDYTIEHIIRDGKAVSMSVLHELYGLNVGVSKYRNKLKKKREEHFPKQYTDLQSQFRSVNFTAFLRISNNFEQNKPVLR